MKNPTRFCDGTRRRDFLRLGAASLLGLPLDLPNLLALQARGATRGAKAAINSDLSVIYVFLKGGLSTIDTFD